MMVRHASDFDYAFVCAHMREQSRREASAMRGEIAPARLAQDYNELAGVAYFRLACCETVTPIALFSAYRTGEPGHAGVHFIATEQWPRIGRMAFRFLRGVVFTRMFAEHGIVRAETDVMETPGALDWLYRLGFVPGAARMCGRNGEWFRRVTWSVDAAAPGLASAPLDAFPQACAPAEPSSPPGSAVTAGAYFPERPCDV